MFLSVLLRNFPFLPQMPPLRPANLLRAARPLQVFSYRPAVFLYDFRPWLSRVV